MEAIVPEEPHSGLLPSPVENGIKSWGARGLGVLLLALTAWTWLALITWSPTAPAAASSPEALGRELADLLMQMLGLAGALLLFPPLFWSVELLTRERIERLRSRALLWPFSALLLATALAALPAPSAWPMEHGFGGMLGDLLFEVISRPAATLDPRIASPLALLLLAMAGGLALSLAIDVDPRSLLSGLRGRNLDVEIEAEAEAVVQPVAMRESLPEPEVAALRPVPEPEQTEEPVGARKTVMGISLPEEGDPNDPLLGDDLDDGNELIAPRDEDSLRMARRFAPGGTPQSPSLDRAEARQAPAAPESEPDLTPGEAPQPESSPLPVRRPAASDVHRLPSLNLLNRSTSSKPAAARAQALQRGQGRLLEDALAEFGVAGRITATRPGPVVTAYDLEPARTVRPQRVVALAEEIARAIGVTSLRVAPDPERPMIVIEVPNVHPDEIALRELLDSDAFRRGAATLPLALGRSSKGEPVIADLSRMTGLLVAGAPGSGKTAGLNAMVLSLLFKLGPAELKLVLFDPRMLELSVYGGLPHLIAPVIAEPWQALAALDWAVREMDERQKRMAAVNMRGIDAFNNAIANARRQGLSLGRRVQTGFDRRTGEPLYEVSTIDSDPLPRIVVVIEELAELMLGCGREVEAALQRLAAGGRASGIHVIAATQRPTPDVLTGAILGALPQRLCYRVASRTDSRTVLGEDGAELLLGLGDHLYADGEGGTALRVHGPHVAEEEAERVAAELSRQARPDFLADVTAAAPRMAPVLAARPAPTLEDGVYERALAIHARDAGIGVRALAARLGIGADRAAEIMARIAREAA